MLVCNYLYFCNSCVLLNITLTFFIFYFILSSCYRMIYLRLFLLLSSLFTIKPIINLIYFAFYYPNFKGTHWQLNKISNYDRNIYISLTFQINILLYMVKENMFYMHLFNYTMLLNATDLTFTIILIPKLNHFFFFLYVIINYIIYAM